MTHPPRTASLLLAALLIGLAARPALAQTPATRPAAPRYATDSAINYRPDVAMDDEYAREMCVLDVYHPVGKRGFATVVWFHGGALEVGRREVPNELKSHGIAIVGVDYRLSPHVKSPVYIQDAAAAVAWTFKHIAEYGGDPDAIYVAGHSAGGYLTSMVGLDKRWLAAEGIDADRIAGLIPYSGHAVTHMTVRKERGIPDTRPVVDDLAPLYHVRPDAPPLVLITGDRELELLGRYEENAYLWRMMKVAGSKTTDLHELGGFDHGGMPAPAHFLLLRWVREHHERAEKAKTAKAEGSAR